MTNIYAGRHTYHSIINAVEWDLQGFVTEADNHRRDHWFTVTEHMTY